MSSRKKRPTRRKTIGQSPLDSLISTPESTPERKRRPSSTRKKTTSKATAASGREAKASHKVRATFHLPDDVIDECRNAVVWLAGPPERLTMARLAEDALRRELARLRKKYMEGEPFPQRAGDLRGGRPIGS